MKKEDRGHAYQYPKLFKNIVAHIASHPDETSWQFKNKLNIKWLKRAPTESVCNACTEKAIWDATDVISEFKVGGYYASITLSNYTGGLFGGGRTLIYKIGKDDTVIFDHVDDSWIS